MGRHCATQKRADGSWLNAEGVQVPWLELDGYGVCAAKAAQSLGGNIVWGAAFHPTPRGCESLYLHRRPRSSAGQSGGVVIPMSQVRALPWSPYLFNPIKGECRVNEG